ncbi:unnamed protein product, partial [Durusdinium trenchii]
MANPFWSRDLQERFVMERARPEDLPLVPEGDSGVSGVGESEEMIPDAHDLLDLLSLGVDQENLEEKSVDDGGRAISAGEDLDKGPQELWRDPQEELQTAIDIQPGWPEVKDDSGARSFAGPPMPPTSWMRRPVEGEERTMALRLKERRPCGDHRIPGQQPEKHQRLDQGKSQRDHLTRVDGHQKAEQQEDRGVPGQQLGEHQRLDQGKGRRDRLGRDDDLQRAIELQVVEELRRQNEELRNEVRALNEKIARGQRHRDRTPGPKTPTTAMLTPMEQPVQVNCRRFHLGHGRSLSRGAQRKSGRVGNVDNVNYKDETAEYITWTMGCWGRLETYIGKVVGAGCTDMQVLTAGSIPDGMNYVTVKDKRDLAPPL